MKTLTEIRPSQLPSLEACRCWLPNDEPAGEAAQRGTKLDSIIREALSRPDKSVIKAAGALGATLKDNDEVACRWAVQHVLQLAEGTPIITREDELRAEHGIDTLKVGTMDTLIPERGILIDYKSGQIRDYRAQMAAYALACMNAYFADEWTAVLLYIDQEETTYMTFTRAEAERLVRGIIDAPAEPHACDKCSWCGRKDDCPLRLQMVEQAKKQTEGLKKLTDKEKELPEKVTFVTELLKDPDKAAQFVEMAAVANSYAEAVKNGIKAQMKEKGVDKIGRFKLSKPGVSKVAPETLVGRYIGDFGHMRVLHAYGSMSAKTFTEMWQLHYGDSKPVPVNEFVEKATAQKLSISKN